MGELFDLLFSNILIVAAIVGGIISWFNGMTKKENDHDHSPKPVSTQRADVDRHDPPANQLGDSSSKRGNIQEYYEERRRHLDEWSKGEANQHLDEGQSKDPHSGLSEKNQMEVYVQEEDKEITGTQLTSSKKWNKKRLAEGIAMAEILGPPRAHKPHRSHPRKR